MALRARLEPGLRTQESFSYNGAGGGSYTFTLQVNVTDLYNQQATASKVITAYNSTGGGGIEVSIGEPIAQKPLPSDFSISQNYPNPFNPETEIVFGLPEPARVSITISDVLGREIITLYEGDLTAGYQQKRWNGVNVAGEKVGSGIYFYRITATGESGKQFTKVLKMLLSK